MLRTRKTVTLPCCSRWISPDHLDEEATKLGRPAITVISCCSARSVQSSASNWPVASTSGEDERLMKRTRTGKFSEEDDQRGRLIPAALPMPDGSPTQRQSANGRTKEA